MPAQPPPAPPPRNAVSVAVAPAPPATIRKGQRFTVTLTATLKRRDRHAYLISFIQYSARACLPDASGELRRTLGTTGAYYHHELSSSPFTASATFTAGAPGVRRVCAYLYRRPIRPGARTRPLATGTAGYAVTR